LTTVDFGGGLGLNCHQLIKSEALGLRQEAQESRTMEMNGKPLRSYFARGSPFRAYGFLFLAASAK
jgi:hypothetical protein